MKKMPLLAALFAIPTFAFALDAAPVTGEFGGHCATGLTKGVQAKTDCSISWEDSVTHKKYCFSSEAMKNEFAKDTKGNLAKAELEYAKVSAVKVADTVKEGTKEMIKEGAQAVAKTAEHVAEKM